jgi:MYXO-CTERM domain-containing protein
MDDGTLRLAGIVSRGPEVCGSGGWYGTPYPALCWVDEHTNAGLSDAACNTCDCLDTKPAKDDGCSCATDDVGLPWLALVLVALRPRARSRR